MMFTYGKDQYKENPLPVYLSVNKTINDQEPKIKRYCLFFVEEGAGTVEFAGRREIFLAPSIFCFNEYEIPHILSEKPIRAKLLYFDPWLINVRFTFENLRYGWKDFSISDERDRHWLRCFFERSDTYYGRLIIGLLDAKRLETLFSSIQYQLEGQPDGYWPCRTRSFLIEILFFLDQKRLLNTSNDITPVMFSKEIEQIILYLYTHYKEKITIPNIVKEFNINRTTLTKKFSLEVGDTIINYLNKLRLNLASMMLRDTGIPVSEICERVGVSDLAHFNRMFKKQFLCSPLQYRKQYR